MTGPSLDVITTTLVEQGVTGVHIAFVDNNGITRSRMIPVRSLPSVAEKGVGVTAVFPVFDSHDGITFAHEGLSTPSGDVRLVPVVEHLAGVIPLAGQPGLAWCAGRQVASDGTPWAYDPRAVLEGQVAKAREAGYEIKAGYEIEMVLSRADEDWAPAHRGPAYSPLAMLEVDEFVRQLLSDLDRNALVVGQIHAEYGEAQIELSLDAAPPLQAADDQVLARQTIHAAARAHGLRASFAPVTTAAGAGNGWHLHTSVWKQGHNAMTGDGDHALSAEGEAYVAGLLRDLHGIVAVTAPSTGSLLRRRPGYWAGAYAYWGVQNREAALRVIPSTPLLGPGITNVELKASDASANPYLALAVVVAAGLAGISDELHLPDPIAEDVGAWSEEQRSAAGVLPLAATFEEQQGNLLSSDLVRDVLGEELLGAFAACREADDAWTVPHDAEEIIRSLRWRY